MRKVQNKIVSYFHCKKCLEELPVGMSPRHWQRTQAGWTKKGLQVWCVRHNENIISLDFEGQKVSMEGANGKT